MIWYTSPSELSILLLIFMRRDKYPVFVFVFLSLLTPPKRGRVGGGNHSSDGHRNPPAVGKARTWEHGHLGKVPLIDGVLLGAPPMLPNMAPLEAATFLMMSPPNHHWPEQGGA